MNESFFIDSLVACINHCMLLFYHNSCTVCIETPVVDPTLVDIEISNRIYGSLVPVSPCTASGGASRSMNRGFPGDISTFGRATKKRVVSSWNCTLQGVAISTMSGGWSNARFFLEQPEVFFSSSGIPKKGCAVLWYPQKMFFLPPKISWPQNQWSLCHVGGPQKPPFAAPPGQLDKQLHFMHRPGLNHRIPIGYYGIFSYMKSIKSNHSLVGKYTYQLHGSVMGLWLSKNLCAMDPS